MLKNLSRFAQNTKINRIFVHVKATYCSHKPTILTILFVLKTKTDLQEVFVPEHSILILVKSRAIMTT